MSATSRCSSIRRAIRLRSGVRELEGALHSLIAHATLTGKRLDMGLAKVALRDTIRHTARAVALKDVERAVCQLFSIEPEALKADNRARAVAYPRMLAMYLARKHTGVPYSEVGRFFGNRNHSTVIAAEHKVAAWIKDEARWSGLLAGFETIGEILQGPRAVLGDLKPGRWAIGTAIAHPSGSVWAPAGGGNDGCESGRYRATRSDRSTSAAPGTSRCRRSS